MRAENLILRGVKQNNLKDIDLDLPLGQTIVVTGPSGSGKSSLAFDTVYAEGQRRFMQSLSTYARQFLEKFRPPDVREILNIPPSIALEQANPVRNSRATVGTTTELYDYYRLLFEKLGVEHCSNCNVPMQRLGYDDLFALVHKKHKGKTVLLSFKKSVPSKKEGAAEFFEDYLRSGYTRFVFGKEIVMTEAAGELTKVRGKEIFFVVDRIKLPDTKSKPIQTRFSESLRQAMDLGLSFAQLYIESDKRTYKLGEQLTTLNNCPKCGLTSNQKSATSFSFNSPLGACERCKGFGNTLEVDPNLVIPNSRLSLAQGAIDPFTKPSLKKWQKKLFEFCKKNKIDADLPYSELTEKQRNLIFDGTKGFKGVRGVFALLEKDRYKMRIRVFISRYTSAFTCPDCQGQRLKSSMLLIKVGDKSISELSSLSIGQAREFFKKLKLTARERKIGTDILDQIERRLGTLDTVGVGYLTLSRLSRTLSGGEYQRILLSTQLSQGLTDTLYVLDEPSIGLHPKDTQRLLEVLQRLRSEGNTLLLVEHDPEIIEWAEHVVDLGPGSGRLGGKVVFSGNQKKFLTANTATSTAIQTWKKTCKDLANKTVAPSTAKCIELTGARENNLKNISIKIPIQALTTVTGVSGSGKSTLIVDTLYPALNKIFTGRNQKIGRFDSISGFEYVTGAELVDQSPIGKSSRSNPITFIKGYDEVRNIFASSRDGIGKNLSPGHFSFNVPGGRCDHCEGEGRIRIDMVFMEDVWIPCPECEEKRFKPNILQVRYRGRNIDQVLKLTVDEAYSFFEGVSSLRSKLAVLIEVGLGYLSLGQSSFTLSGGEAQRLKIARELGRIGPRSQPTLFILDEPTTGLHFDEITRLIYVLKQLVRSGHTVVVIEHNVQLISAAQYLIDLGPDGGEHGGHVVSMGTPKQLAQTNLAHTGKHLAEILGV